MEHDRVKTGTTTMAIKCKDGIVVAADKRATVGNMIMSEMTKVIPIDENMALTIAGQIADAQLLIKHLKAELRIKELQLGRKTTIKEAANLLGAWVYSGIRQSGMITHFILSGIDTEGASIYDVFPDGTVTFIDKFEVSGSGGVFAKGLIETEYKPGIDVLEGVELTKRAMNSALVNDSASGNGADIYKVTSQGLEKVETINVPRGIPGV